MKGYGEKDDYITPRASESPRRWHVECMCTVAPFVTPYRDPEIFQPYGRVILRLQASNEKQSPALQGAWSVFGLGSARAVVGTLIWYDFLRTAPCVIRITLRARLTHSCLWCSCLTPIILLLLLATQHPVLLLRMPLR